ncbi:MAG TPA: hypothetical protein VF195_09850 [Actinomycetota bacterium]
MEIPERYVRLCLRVGRHLDGFVDSFIGPSEMEQTVEAEEAVDPKGLRDEAQLLLDGLGDADLSEDRRRWLRGQLESLACVTDRLAGEEITWADEVERCLGVRPSRTDTSVLEEVHGRLDAALQGNGSLRERYNAWDANNAVPREKLVPALERLQQVLGPRAHAFAPMPAEESVSYELVSDVPWIAYNRYEGRHHSRVEVNADLPVSVVLLVSLAAHEAYPGHHTERVAKDVHLYRHLGRMETSVAISAPESLVSEGIATNALDEALGREPFAVVADVLAGIDLRFDPVEAHEVHEAELALYAPAVNAAFMLHEEGASTDDVEGFLREWALESNERTARTVAFLTDPSSRAYVSAYPDGRRLCRDFADRAPGNFTRLLTEQLTATDLLP